MMMPQRVLPKSRGTSGVSTGDGHYFGKSWPNFGKSKEKSRKVFLSSATPVF